MAPFLVIAMAYLMGSIPFGYLVVRASQGADVRETGSGGTGATNVSRKAGKAAGLLTLLLDAAKGTVAVVLARLALTSHNEMNWFVGGAALAAIVGHCFPIWLRFRGGKGVATGVGVFAVLAPLALVLAAAVFVLIVWSVRYVSLGSITAAVGLPFFIALQNRFVRPVAGFQYVITLAIAGGVLILFMHRANIIRLLRGTENKFK